jgi:hypothetical protein
MLYDDFPFYMCRVNSIKVMFALEVMMRQLCGGEAVEASMSRFIDCAAIYIRDVILLNVHSIKHSLGRFFLSHISSFHCFTG